jgi:hypothetical protein
MSHLYIERVINFDSDNEGISSGETNLPSGMVWEKCSKQDQHYSQRHGGLEENTELGNSKSTGVAGV